MKQIKGTNSMLLLAQMIRVISIVTVLIIPLWAESSDVPSSSAKLSVVRAEQVTPLHWRMVVQIDAYLDPALFQFGSLGLEQDAKYYLDMDIYKVTPNKWAGMGWPKDGKLNKQVDIEITFKSAERIAGTSFVFSAVKKKTAPEQAPVATGAAQDTPRKPDPRLPHKLAWVHLKDVVFTPTAADAQPAKPNTDGGGF